MHTIKDKTVKFHKWTCQIQKAQYENGRPALTLVDATGEDIATATVNLPDIIMPENYAGIKEGLL